MNGVVAMVSGNQFVANHVTLEEGENTITASSTDPNGGVESASITISADTTADYEEYGDAHEILTYSVHCGIRDECHVNQE